MNEFLFDKILLGLGIIIQIRLLFYLVSKGFKNVNEKYKNNEKRRRVNIFLCRFIFMWLIIGVAASLGLIIFL